MEVYMKSYDYYGYTTPDGGVLCTECCEDKGLMYPIFADSEWDYYPVCDCCGQVLDYVNLTGDGD